MMKVVGNDLAISAKKFIGQTIYLKMQRSRRDIDVVVTVISRRFVDSNIKEGKNNAI